MHIRRILFICLFAFPLLMAAQSTSPAEPSPNDFVTLDKDPQPLNIDSVRKALVYPPLAMEAQMEGKVILRVLIDESGKYVKHIIVKNPTTMLTQAAEKQVRYVRFEPATRGGRTVKFWVTIPFDFRLPDEVESIPLTEIESIERTNPSKEIGPNDFVLLEKEPAPLNMNELASMIGYPPAAKEAEIEGKVILRVQVDEKGNYVKHEVIKDPHPYLTNAVTSKISALRFTPGIQNGKPIKVWVTIPFDFKLLKNVENEEKADAPTEKIKPFYSLESALACPDPALVTELYLNGKSLKTIPLEVLKFPNLWRLELGDNQLTKIPAEILALKKLRVLGLSMNQLSSLPAGLWSMPSLKVIDVSKNAFDKKTQKLLEKEHGDKLFPKDAKGKVIW